MDNQSGFFFAYTSRRYKEPGDLHKSDFLHVVNIDFDDLHEPVELPENFNFDKKLQDALRAALKENNVCCLF